LEIIGISFDQDRAALERMIKDRGMSWPQFFDGKGWQNEFGQRYGIRGIPTMWLVDKQGELATTNARDDLAGKVQALLRGEKLSPMTLEPRVERVPAVPKLDIDLSKRDDLPTLREAPNRSQLEGAIANVLAKLKRYSQGHVVIGRVALDGPGDPEDVHAQMPILAGGYFAGETRDLVRPIGFRMHGYAPVDLQLRGKSGEIVDVGTVRLAAIPAAELLNLKGTVELEGVPDARAATVSLSVSNGPINTPHNGISPRGRWSAPIKATISPQGAVSASGFSPIRYYCEISAPGHVKQVRYVTFTPGAGADLGTVRLERPRRITLSYIVASARPFDVSRKKQAVLKGGDRWKATSDIYGWDLEFRQHGGAVMFDYSYAPCHVQDLGAGTLEGFVDQAAKLEPRDPPRNLKLEQGRVYLVHQAHWKRWILFTAEIE
jgi:hypothetical protein